MGWDRVSRAGKGSNGRHDLRLVVSSFLLGIVHRGEGRSGQRRGSGRLGSSEPRALDDEVTELGDGDPLGWVKLKDALHDGIQFSGNRQDGAQELGVLHVGAEGAVFE